MEQRIHLIRPDIPFEAQYPLSTCDTQLPVRFVRQAFLYASDQDTFSSSEAQDLVSRLQDSLKSFLRQPEPGVLGYPQLLGRIVQPADDTSPCITVKKSSAIHFNVVHKPEIEFSSFHTEQGFPEYRTNISDFRIGLERNDMLESPEGPHNFAVQITFVRGGFVLLIQASHQMTDGYGLAGFIKHWFRRTRSGSNAGYGPDMDPFSTMAMHDKSELSRENIEGETAGLRKLEDVYSTVATTSNPFMGTGKTVSQIFWVSPHMLEELRAMMQAYSPKPPTIFQCIVVLLWRCIVRTRLTSASDAAAQRSKVVLVTNMRGRLEPSLPADYFGNAATGLFVHLPISNVAEADGTSTAISAVQQVLQDDTSDLNLRLTNQLIGRQLKNLGISIPVNLLGHDLIFNSWEHLFPDVSDLDIGLGDFCRMRYLMDSPITPSYVMVLPTYGMRKQGSDGGHPGRYPGGIEVQVNLLSPQMERLLQDQEWLQYACPV
ncbi:hypothetical protein GQ53DRAFT_886720 [Thozetella sp. PMI_491]|nr:hypothetical protein GQ53DRAFT_886720 [Thozetella sp. PMI_491]